MRYTSGHDVNEASFVASGVWLEAMNGWMNVDWPSQRTDEDCGRWPGTVDLLRSGAPRG